MSKRDEEKLKKITEHFGASTQIMKFIEEVGEFQNECYKRLYIDPAAGNIKGEKRKAGWTNS